MPPEKPLPIAKRTRKEAGGDWRRVGVKQPCWMRIEGSNQHRPPLRAAQLDSATHHRLMAAMKSVEIAERDDAAAQMGRNRRAAVQPLHGGGYRKSRGDFQSGVPARRQEQSDQSMIDPALR